MPYCQNLIQFLNHWGKVLKEFQEAKDKYLKEFLEEKEEKLQKAKEKYFRLKEKSYMEIEI